MRKHIRKMRISQLVRTIATASERTNVDFFVTHLNLEQWFSTAKLVFDDGVRPSKPVPDIYMDAAEALDLRPTDCIVVEDAVRS